MLVVVVAVTGFSVTFNALTRPPEHLAADVGSYVRVGTSQVHYETWGTTGTPMVLVPGFLESSVAWSAVGPLLGEHHVVYALDLPGDGYTRYSGSMRLRDQAELVAGFIRALHLDKPILVGHSLGAAVIGSVALAHPEDASKLVFADGDGLPINLGPRWTRSLLLHSPYPTTLLRIGSHWTWLDESFIRGVCAPRCTALTPALVKRWVRPLHQAAGERALRQMMITADYGLTPAQISAIAVPAAIIWGSDDQQGGSLAQAIGNLHHPPTHVISGAGHLTMLADPTAFVAAIDSP